MSPRRSDGAGEAHPLGDDGADVAALLLASGRKGWRRAIGQRVAESVEGELEEWDTVESRILDRLGEA